MENVELFQVKSEMNDDTNTIENEDVHSEGVFVKEELVCNSDSDSNSNEYSERTHKELSPNEEKPFRCNYRGCKKSFKNKKNLWNHNQTHLNVRSYKCKHKDCGKSFRTSHKLTAHMVIHSNVRRFKCTYEGCSKVFRHKHHLVHHLKLHSDERPFVCTSDGCSKTFKTKRDLWAHLRIHSDDRPFMCEREGCFKTFKTKEIFKCHLLVHSDSKPFQCTHEGCDKTYNLKNKMLHHLKTHSRNNIFKCNFDGCGRIYKQEKHLNSHMVSTHLPKSYLVIEPVHCTHDGCNSVLNTKRSLYDHMRRHRLRQAGVKYSCKYENCLKEYTSETGLRKHLKTHGTSLNFLYDSCETIISGKEEQNSDEDSSNSFEGIVKSEIVVPGLDNMGCVLSNCENLENSPFYGDATKVEDPLL